MAGYTSGKETNKQNNTMLLKTDKGQKSEGSKWQAFLFLCS
jgi:hypothetical protein